MESGGTYESDAWDSRGEAALRAAAGSVEDAFAAALTAMIRLARGERAEGEVGIEQESSIAVPIRGQGRDYEAVFTELAGDLLAQLDVNGTGLDVVRVDGLLETETGYSAWGYALGAAEGPEPVLGLSLIDRPRLGREGDRTVLTVRVRQSP